MKSIRQFRGLSPTLPLIWACVASLCSISPAWSNAEDQSSPYDDVWRQVSQLLEVREYASALEVLAEATKDPDLEAFRDRLKVDQLDLQRLQRLATMIKERASRLKPGDSVKVGNSEYKFERFVSDAQGDRMVLASPPNSTKTEKTLSQLDPKSWITLAESQLSTSAEDRYVVGMFQASVENGDRRAARQALNLAAADKISVTHWTARIDAEAKAKEVDRTAKKAEREDRILGSWRLVIGEGKNEHRVNVTFRERGKTDKRTSTWRKTKNEDYVLSFPNGATARLNMGPKGEGLKGNMANGAPVKGFRQSKAK